MEVPTLYYDGDCGFCTRTAAWMRGKSRNGSILFEPFQSAPDPPMVPEIRLACERGIHLFTTDGKWIRHGRAFLFAMERCGWGWFAKALAIPPFVWIIEFGYTVVSNNRDFFARFFFRE